MLLLTTHLLPLTLQVGVTAMLVASKYEEIWAPEVNDFVYISDKAYSREDILGMEKTMLATLQYDLTVPTAFLFTARFRKAAGVLDDLRVRLRRTTAQKHMEHALGAV
jgi:G2/mitotic-specific cyclin-B, other